MRYSPVLKAVGSRLAGRTGRDRVKELSRLARVALRRSAALQGQELPDPLLQQDDGAPLPWRGFHWSVSHKENWVAACLAPRPLGIDVEELVPRSPELHARIVSSEEANLFPVATDPWELFYRVFTAKEAVLKIHGEGLVGLGRCRVRQVLDDERMILGWWAGRESVESRHGVRHYRHAGHLFALTAEADDEVDWLIDATEGPQVRVARAAGFCFGVKRALDMVESLITKADRPLYLLGPLIHNPQVMEDLRSRGVLVVDSLAEARPPGTLVIRTHGVPDRVITEARDRGLAVVDAICPRVRHVHELSRQEEADGRLVLLFGEADHPEVRGIAGNLGHCRIFESLQELQSMDLPHRISLLAQTTQSVESFREILAWLTASGRDVTHHDTICHATRCRQDAAAALAAETDLMIVVGGRDSGNTQRLYHICQQLGPALHVESWRELPGRIPPGLTAIGVTAGASTPERLVREVVEFLESGAGSGR